MQYWLLKTEPETFSFNDLVQRESEPWDGVRNYQARNNMQKMELGDKCLIYHSGKEKAVVGIAEVVKTAYPEPGMEKENWVCIDIKALNPCSGMSLEEVKQHPDLQNIPLLKQSRLSVMPLDEKDFLMLSAS